MLRSIVLLVAVVGMAVAQPVALDLGYPTVLQVPDANWLYVQYTAPAGDINKNELGSTRLFVETSDITRTFCAALYFSRGTPNNITVPTTSSLPIGFGSGARSGFVTLLPGTDTIQIGINADCNHVCRTVTTTINAYLWWVQPDSTGYTQQAFTLLNNRTTGQQFLNANEYLYMRYNNTGTSDAEIYLLVTLLDPDDKVVVYYANGRLPTAASYDKVYPSGTPDAGTVATGKEKLAPGLWYIAVFSNTDGPKTAGTTFTVTMGIGFDPAPSSGASVIGLAVGIPLGIIALCLIIGGGYYLYTHRQKTEHSKAHTEKIFNSIQESKSQKDLRASASASGGREEESATVESATVGKSAPPREGAAAASLSSDERAKFEKEIKALKDENANLKRHIRHHRGKFSHSDEKDSGSSDIQLDDKV